MNIKYPWNENELLVQRIVPDNSFVQSAFDKATDFFKVGILPELLGNWYPRAPTYTLAAPDPGNDQDDSSNFPADSKQLWCFCQQPESDPSCTDHSDLPATFSLSFLHRPSWTGEMVKFILYVYSLSILLLVQLNLVVGSPQDVPVLSLASPQLVSVCLFVYSVLASSYHTFCEKLLCFVNHNHYKTHTWKICITRLTRGAAIY